MIKRPIYHKDIIIIHQYAIMVSRMSLSPKCHTQIPKFCEYITLHGEKDFEDAIKFMDL